VLAEWASEAQLAAVFHQRAKCAAFLGEEQDALSYYNKVFEEQRRNRGHVTDAHLDFGWYCVTRPLPDLFPDVIRVLDEFNLPPIFPIQIYLDSAVRSLVHDSWQEHDAARFFAVRALAAAAQDCSPLKRHPRLGLVNCKESDVHRRLIAISA